ncbi:venom allergen 3-like [Tachypleus tridentatus]|uniref:venom allergen 3-like n=1 Tax=Tachypleus tridentatus TaxID=6853 RepID=UPI003FD14C95
MEYYPSNLLLSVVFAILLYQLTLVFSCEYQNIYSDHTMCKYTGQNPSCKILKRLVLRSEINEIVQAHNELRQRVATGKETNQPEASNMRKMSWDEELAEVAQRWADQCNFKHDCAKCREVERFGAGQNLAISMSSNDNATADWREMIRKWYDEVKTFSSSYISRYQFVSNTGHYTQVTWANTFKVGCGYTYYKNNEWYTKFYVCNYGPAGNVLGQEIYKKGKPCSECPSGTKCSMDFQGLCD